MNAMRASMPWRVMRLQRSCPLGAKPTPLQSQKTPVSQAISARLRVADPPPRFLAAAPRPQQCRSFATPAVPPGHTTPEVFSKLANAVGISMDAELRPVRGAQHGLFSTRSAVKGQVLMSVPRHLAIVVDYENGLRLPEGPWPRLREGILHEEPLPWDLLEALALVDAVTGEGNTFWQEYCQFMLPRPRDLTLPMCWSPARLAQLQHIAIIEAARKQQARLCSLFPHLMEPLDHASSSFRSRTIAKFVLYALGNGMDIEQIPDDTPVSTLLADEPSWMQWALACVKSRACRVGAEAFAIIPFIDMANHNDKPSTDFRPAGRAEGNGTGATFELFANQDIAAGQELTISYSGADGYTNQRWMAQYGFVPAGGNFADRLALHVPEGYNGQLELERWQQVMGDELFLQVVGGQHPQIYAALKSLPLMEESGVAAGARGGEQLKQEQQLNLVANLTRQCEQVLSEAPTSIEEDEQLLATRGSAASIDVRHAAAVRYRLARKQLASTCKGLLDVYRRLLMARPEE